MSAPVLSSAELVLLDAVRDLRFGTIEVVIHDGRVVRIEKLEKIRLEVDPSAGDVAAAADNRIGRRPDRRSPPTSNSGGSTCRGSE
jgi:hypothetical protein